MRTSQRGVHSRLATVVRRHVRAKWREPVHPGSRATFRRFVDAWDGRAPLLLDAGCGTGAATAALAEAHPDRFVVGIDRSAHRLARAGSLPANGWLGQARLEDFWRLMERAGIRAEQQFLLYPNPWPKRAHLKRRWHGHPVLPTLIRTADRLELRSNWRLYLEEFRYAARLCGASTEEVVSFRPSAAISLFERKYIASGLELFRLILTPEKPR